MIADFGRDLGGYGVGGALKNRALTGSTFGPSFEGRRLSPQEQKEIEDRLRLAGQLNLASAR